MVKIREFDGLVYNNSRVNDLSSVLAPPHDVIPEEYRQDLMKKENNIVHLILPESYQKAGNLLDEMIDQDLLTKTEPSLFIYGIEFQEGKEEQELLGLVALLELTELGKEVMPHELTFNKILEERLALLKETRTNFSPLFMIYEGENKALDWLRDGVSKKPFRQAVDRKGRTHRLWKVGENTKKFKQLLKNKNLIIADGHHRYQTALKHSKNGGSRWIMTLLIDSNHPSLRITTPHRLVKKIPQSFTEIKKSLSNHFNLSEFNDKTEFLKNLKTGGRGNFGAYFPGKGFLLMRIKDSVKPEEIIKGDMKPELKKLDIVILHKLVFAQLLGIYTHGNISFCKNLNDALKSADSGENEAVFTLNPVTPEQIMKVTNLGERMPHKSTYFYPKPLSGLIMYKD